ncbi:MAG: hypothetical protein HONBIEJF_00327 [Fimbriimonadaceae bacterium]|nr:hypothetical protein [Fimbriimonadaceae bacterium]
MTNAKASSTSEQVRQYLVDAARLDLVGPGRGLGNPDERLRGRERPSNWYLTGFLIPTGTPPEQAADVDEDEEFELVGEPSGQPGESIEDKKAAKKGYFPSSMGLSFLTAAEVRELKVTVSWGDYEYHQGAKEEEGEEAEVDAEEADSDVRISHWQRIPRREVLTARLTGAQDPVPYNIPHTNGLQIQVVDRVIDAPGLEDHLPRGTRSVSIFLVNHRQPQKERSDAAFAFQTELEVFCEQGFVPQADLRGAFAEHWDECVADLHYSTRPEYATGHAVSADWDLTDVKCHTVRTSWIPSAEVEKTTTVEFEGLEVCLDALGALEDGASARASLSPLVEQYRAWIAKQESGLDQLQSKRRETADGLLSFAKVAADRLQDGIDVLEKDADALEAFRIANRAVSRALKKRLKDDNPKWRAFQMAFILLNLPGIADPLEKNRPTVDLLFFPTGGGKTEAYLGLAAFAIVMRRLRNPGDEGKAGAGVSVIMRYTLRLLTLDQLARASGLICALELEREANVERLGAWPFEIGLWVGKAGTPNLIGAKGDKRSDTARTLVRQFKNDPKGNPAPIPLDSCPWCGEKFTPDSFQLLPNDDHPTELRIVCSNFECDFTRGRALPIVAVDEPLYRRLPAFVIGTVDKFASLPWVGTSGSLLGRASRHDSTGFYGAAESGKGSPLSQPLLPPDLVIQDELHLISGPLGTMMGLYEIAIGALCARKISRSVVGPKIVASTATVRRAHEQIQSMFGRPVTAIFPPPGPSVRDSFFAKTVPSAKVAARLYLGVAAQGRNPKVVMRRTWLALMGAAQRAYRDAGGGKNKENPADPYMTVLGYFNSLKELGGGRRILEEEVQNTIKAYGKRRRLGEGHSLFADRRTFSEVVELTSRVSTNEVSEARTRLGLAFGDDKWRVDCAIATNMISVGLDIPRLGLMVVLGQPKTNSEYIQATSRVGRTDSKPGLVVTLLNIHKPRDRSHYERFRHYHETFYRAVEASSVTPFSARALDRGFAGVLVGLSRHLEPSLTPPMGAEGIAILRPELERELLDVFLARVNASPFACADELEERLRSVQNRVVSLLDSWKRVLDEFHKDGVQMQYQKYELKTPQPLLRDVLDKNAPADWQFRANRSLRDVEPDVALFLKPLGGRPVGGLS